MATFLSRSQLGRGDLRLFLTNHAGNPQDAVSVRWTIYSSDNKQVSGKELQAVRARVGEYYAPWQSDVANGNYRIVWQIQEEWQSSPTEKTEYFFVVDPSSYTTLGPISQSGIPNRGEWNYLSGTVLIRGDLPLYLRDGAGYLTDANSVMWTILDASGRAVSSRTVATRADVGEYYAAWAAMVPSGDYEILWEWQLDSDSPLQSQRMRFGIILPAAPFAIVIPPETMQCIQIDLYPKIATVIPQIGAGCSYQVSCVQYPSTPCSSPPVVYPPPVGGSGSSSSFEIPRVMHLVSGVLPASGNFTNQAPYSIPQQVRSLTFYISYTHGVTGGFPALQLLWGDGVSEFNETLLDTTIEVNNPSSNQNLHLQEFDGPVPIDGNPVNFMIETTIPGGARSARLIIAERGQPPSPGIASITLTAST